MTRFASTTAERVPSRIEAEPSALYDRDYFAWTLDQAAKLRDGRLGQLDIDNLVDEVESLGRSVKREIASRLNVLTMHLLKWRYQAAHRSSGWKGTIVEQRTSLQRELRESPSLKSFPATILADEYRSARLKAAGETGLPEERFPKDCPFTVEEVLDPDFWPDEAP